jgi:hypothetical protein
VVQRPPLATFAWDALGGGGGGSSGMSGGILKLTDQESTLFRMTETNPMEYTLADQFARCQHVCPRLAQIARRIRGRRIRE